MIAFWLSAAALTVVALALLLRPLFWRMAPAGVTHAAANISVYRDQLRELDADLAAGKLERADYERARLELEARLLADVRRPDEVAALPARRGIAPAIGIAVPLLAAALYFLTGDPAAIDRQAEHAADAGQVEAMVARLATRLRENPDDAEGWKLLARSYTALGRFDLAVDAYAKALTRAPRDAQLLADFADALAMARGQRLEGEPEKLVLHALEIDPNNLKALALAGTAAFDRKDYVAAAAYWERMLPHVAPGSEDAQSIERNVAEAKSFLKPQSAAAAVLQGTVSIASGLRAKAAPDDTVFIFARAAEGPPMPLAVVRARVRDLPYRFKLDDSMAMTPATKLSSFPRVIVGARVSKSGAVAPQAGDLQGTSAAVANTAAGVSVVIDREVR